MKNVIAVAALLLASVVYAAPKVETDKTFYIYSDKGAMTNHFIPSGWMGDYGDLKFSDSDTSSPVDGRTAIKIIYSGEAKQGANWTGIYWQHPANNWGEKQGGGYDLSKYTKLTLWAKGAMGGEKLAKFCTGGITGTFMDSDAVEIGPIVLTKDWKKYEIPLKDHDMRNISGGLCWAASKDDNPNGFTIYLDEIRFEK